MKEALDVLIDEEIMRDEGEGFAQDEYCSNTMRALTGKEVIKHVGDMRNVRTWWEETLGYKTVAVVGCSSTLGTDAVR